jgi:hypothetical protein
LKGDFEKARALFELCRDAAECGDDFTQYFEELKVYIRRDKAACDFVRRITKGIPEPLPISGPGQRTWR